MATKDPGDENARAASERQPPEGYERIAEGYGFSDRLQPFYRRIDGDDVSLGFFVDKQHCNLMGICHGGALMTLADIGAASSLHAKRDEAKPSPTINLSFDFMSAGKLGRWLYTRSDHVQVKRRFGFCSGAVMDGDVPIVRYSGVFYYPDHEGMVPADIDPAKLRAFSKDRTPR